VVWLFHGVAFGRIWQRYPATQSSLRRVNMF